MSGLLIPFGLDRSANTIVEPEDAERGRACNCICPGCHAPLLSRHPKEHRVHFAHDSKHPEAKPEEECPFSSAVAVAMMVREIADQLVGKALLIPKLNGRRFFECCGKVVDFSVTSQKRLTITSACKKPVIGNQVFDLEMCFGNAKIFVDLYYKGKPMQDLLNENVFTENKAGVLAINCDSFDAGVLVANKKLRFSDAAQYFLLSAGKRVWRFHPRQAVMSARADSSHECKPVNKRGDNRFSFKEGFDPIRENERNASDPVQLNTVTSPPFEPKMYRCTMCEREWLQKEAGAPVCAHCNTHLFSITT